MTKQEIVNAVIDAIDHSLPLKGFNDQLTTQENVTATDAGAGALETVNPTNNYPPVAK